MSRSRQIALALAIALLAGLASFLTQSHFGYSDLFLAHCGAQQLLAGLDPYDCPREGWPSNPLTTVLTLVPLAGLPLLWAGVVVMAASAGLFALGVLRQCEPWRLLALCSYPAFITLRYSQWSILILAVAYLPELYFLLAVKPHAGVGIGLLRLTWRRFAGALAFVALTLAILPDWPWRWLVQVSNYDGSIPILMPGMAILVVIAAALWHVESARWFIIAMFTFQRAFYDQILFFAVPTTPRGMAVTVTMSWLLWPIPDPRVLPVVAFLVLLTEQRALVRKKAQMFLARLRARKGPMLPQ